MATADSVRRIRRRLEDQQFPLLVERRLDSRGIAGYLRRLMTFLTDRHRDLTRVVNSNTQVPMIEVGAAGGIPYSGNWAAAAGGGFTLHVWKTPWEDVICVGECDRNPRTPAFLETMFTLPEGFRPSATVYLTVWDRNLFTPQMRRVNVNANGVVAWAGTTSFNNGIYFSHTWRAEQ